MKLPLICLAWLGAASALPVHAACYTVYQGNNIAYRSTLPPVDLSQPYGETLPARFGSGASMIAANDETGCIQVVLLGGAPPEGISRGGAARSRPIPASTASTAYAIPEGLWYIAQYRILVCLTCQTGVRPGKASKAHFRGVHRWTGQ